MFGLVIVPAAGPAIFVQAYAVMVPSGSIPLPKRFAVVVGSAIDWSAPAFAVGAPGLTTIAMELKDEIALEQLTDVKLVTVTVVVPTFKRDVVKIPFPASPEPIVMVAVFPTAVVAPLRLYVTVYVPSGKEDVPDLRFTVAAVVPQYGPVEVVATKL